MISQRVRLCADLAACQPKLRQKSATAHYLKFRQFLAGCECPDLLAANQRFYPELLKVFRAVAPLVRFLNEPLLAHASLTASADEGVSERELLGMR